MPEKTVTDTHFISSEEEDSLLSFGPGDSFGKRYQVVEEVGRGGMGRVYKAKDKDLGIVVALKMIHPELLSKRRAVERFKKELLLARGISHENVVRIHDFGEIERIKFISMEYIDGENLGELIQTSGPLSTQAVINISRQICRGLKAAHKQGIIHRDLKPANIMVDKNGKVYITDFGLAKSMEDHGVTVSGTVVGTPRYLSPEQAKGESLDQRSDIYTLGIIMYEMVTGREIFASETMIGYLQKHIQQKPSPPSSINPVVPPFLETIILRCLEKSPERRYQDLDEIVNDLDEEKTSSGIFYLRYRTKKLLKIAAAVLMVLIAAVVLYFALVKREPALPGIRSIAILPFECKTGNEDMALWQGAMQSLLNSDMKQSRHLRVLPESRLRHILGEMEKRDIDKNSLDMYSQFASRENVDYFICGEVSELESRFKISANIFEVKGWRYLKPEIVERGAEEDFFALVDRLTREIKRRFGLSLREIESDIDQDAAELVGALPQAYKYCWQGERLYREGEYERSITVLKKAVDLDPGYALAYTWMAINSIYQGHDEEAKDSLIKAYKVIDRAPKRDRYLIEAFFSYIIERSPENAKKKYLEMLREFPDDEAGTMRLGSIYRNQEEWQEAETLFKDVLANDDRSQIACLNLVYVYKASGQYDKALKLLQDNQHLFPGDDTYHYYLARIRLYQGKHDLARAEIDKLDPTKYVKTDLMGLYHHTRGELDRAEERYRQLVEWDDPDAQVTGRSRLCSLYLLRGQYRRCREEIGRGIECSVKAGRKAREAMFFLFGAYLNLRMKESEQALEAIDRAIQAASAIVFTPTAVSIESFALYLKGCSYLQMKSIKEAKNSADELERLIEASGSEMQMGLPHLLWGFLAQEEKRDVRAIVKLGDVEKLLPYNIGILEDRAFYLGALADACLQRNDTKKAERLYKEITKLTLGRIKWGDIYARSFYFLGTIYDKGGNIELAAKNYDEFLRLFRDADPGTAELEDARKRLKALTIKRN